MITTLLTCQVCLAEGKPSTNRGHLHIHMEKALYKCTTFRAEEILYFCPLDEYSDELHYSMLDT